MEEQKKDIVMQEEQDKKQGTEKKKKKKPDTMTFICMVVGILLIVFALSQLIPVLYHYITEENAYEDMREEYVSVDDTKKKNVETEADKNWWYENISVDLEALQKENKEAAAWIRFDSMDLSYPVMYSGDNEKYLHRDLDGKDSKAGSLFIDEKNSPDFSDRDTIIYGHNMKNLSMFGRLKKYKKDGFYKDNQYFTIYTTTKAYRYHIFSYFDIDETNDFFFTSYESDDAMASLISTMKKKSYTNTGVEVSKEDKVVTLSTCSAEGYRFLVNAVLEEEHDMTTQDKTTQEEE